MDRGLLGSEDVDECLPCIYKKKSGILKRKQVINTNLTMVLMLYFPRLYHSFITMLVFFFFWKNSGSFDQILFTWAHNGLHTQLGCRWLHKPKQLIEQINLSVNNHSQPLILTHENGIFVKNVSPEKWSFLNMFYFRTRIKADQPPILFCDSSTVSKYRNEKKIRQEKKKSTSDML